MDLDTTVLLALDKRNSDLLVDRVKGSVKEVSESGAKHPVTVRLSTTDASSAAVVVSINDTCPVLCRDFDNVVTKLKLERRQVLDLRALYLVRACALEILSAEVFVINIGCRKKRR